MERHTGCCTAASAKCRVTGVSVCVCVAALSASLSSRWTVEWESLPHCCNPTACFHINTHKFGLFHSWHRSGFTLITILWIYVSWKLRLSFLLHYAKSDYFLGHVQIHRSRANKKKGVLSFFDFSEKRIRYGRDPWLLMKFSSVWFYLYGANSQQQLCQGDLYCKDPAIL